MSATDKRIVSMEFDNARFLKNLRDTMKGLEDLKRQLDFAAQEKNIEGLRAAGSRFNLNNMSASVEILQRKMQESVKDMETFKRGFEFSGPQRNLANLKAEGNRFNLVGMSHAVEGMGAKFVAMSTIAIAALAHITTAALDAGARIGKSLTLDLALDGFHEYETKIGSIQTIMANTAKYNTPLSTVERELDKLNEYADLTIYNFGDMTRNIGLFTNAGLRVEDATSMIKGFSNAAAASGTSAEGAASAAYQLSQALSAGTIRLMDWKSLQNVGMGNKNMQEGIVDIANAMGTLKKAGISSKEATAHFNESLEKGWLSADVMSKYLRIMAGDMSDAEMKSIGLSKAQIANFKKTQVTAQEAAQKVRTLTQLIGTTKEAIGSGWGKTFELLFGNFNEATELFTSLSNVIGGFVNKTSDARNALIEGWDAKGGRKLLFTTLTEAFHALLKVIVPIQQAFRSIFPPATVDSVLKLTSSFSVFVAKLQLSEESMGKLKRVFSGVFAAFHIIGAFLKESAGLIGNFFGEFRNVGRGVSDFAVRIADLLVKWDAILVKGGGLHDFFLKLHAQVDKVSDILTKVGDAVKNFFGAMGDAGDRASEAVDKVGKRFGFLEAVGEKLAAIGRRIGDAFGFVFDKIGEAFKGLGDKIANSLTPSQFDAAVDAVNVGLLGGILILLKKFLQGDFDITGGVLTQVLDVLGQVKETLKAMETQLKTKAIMEIAIAMGILAASIVALSMVDSGNLGKALTAITVGLTQLVATLAIIQKMDMSASSGLGLTAIAISMNLVATSMVVLAGAVALLGQLSWEELAKGLSAVTAMLTMMVGAAKLIEGNAVGMIASSVAMIGMATALAILAGAVSLFARMSWGEMAKGLVAVMGSLLILTAFVDSLPAVQMLAAGLAMIPLATGLVILADAVIKFGQMSWGEIGRGLVVLGGALLLITAAMDTMPPTLPLTAAGLVLVAVALKMMVPTIQALGEMDWDTLKQGLGGLAFMLAILALGMIAMEAGLAGAAATIVVAGALLILSQVMKTLGGMSVKELIMGLVAMAATLGVLAGMAAILTPLIPSLLSLGWALMLVGGAFALFGVGVFLTAKAFEKFADVGLKGVKVFVAVIIEIIKAVPSMVAALIEAVVGSTDKFLEAMTTLIDVAVKFLDHLLDGVVKLLPKLMKTGGMFFSELLALIRGKFPELVATGALVTYHLLAGIKQNIPWIVQMASDIIVKFLNGLSANIGRIVDAGINLIVNFLDGISGRIGDIINAGSNILTEFLKGLAMHIINVANAAFDIIAEFIRAMGNNAQKIIDAGADVLVKFIEGIGRDIIKVTDKVREVAVAFLNGIAKNAVKFAEGAADALIYFLNGMADAIRTKSEELRKAGLNIATAIISGITGGLSEKADDVVKKGIDLGKKLFGGFMAGIDASSPSKKFRRAAHYVVEGVLLGLRDKTGEAEDEVVWMAERIVDNFAKTINSIPAMVGDMEDFQPVITPVLNLNKVKLGAQGLSDLLSVNAISPRLSAVQARHISTTNERIRHQPQEAVKQEVRDVTFIQNNSSPKPLRTADIYRNSRSQFARVKEALGIK